MSSILPSALFLRWNIPGSSACNASLGPFSTELALAARIHSSAGVY